MSGGRDGGGRTWQHHGRHRLKLMSLGQDLGAAPAGQPMAMAAAGIGTWRLSRTDRWVSRWNDQMFHLFGVQPGDPDAQRIAWHRIEPSHRWAHEKQVGRAKRTGTFDDVVPICTVSGQTRWLRFQGRRLGDRGAALYGVCQDVTEQRENEAELREARQIAEKANQAKNEFLANMSHEIRSPITAILGYCEMLGDYVPDNQSAEYLETIHRNGLHLLDLINDILDTSKIEAGQMDLCVGPVHLPTELRTVIGLMRSRAAEKNLELVVRADGRLPETIQTDARRLRQILINLIGNAIKFTDRGGVTVHLAVDRAAQAIRVDITDTGVGIAPDDQAGLFEPFTQTEASAARKQEGTGLGLCISRRLAQLLGGDIRMRSRPGAGSTFTATLATGPLHEAPSVDLQEELACPARPRHPGERSLPCRVLVIDDRSDMRLLVRRLLERADAEVTDADEGQRGLAVALEAIGRNRPFDAILVDIQMPVMDGYETARRLRKAGYTGPVIALTAHAMQGDQQKCHDAGCSGYLSKPIDHRILIETLQRQIHRWPQPK